MSRPTLSLITAMDKNSLIGKDNRLPWHLPEDLAFFKQTTLNKPIVMGRKTFESIGRPLPQRTNIIISRDHNYKIENCIVLDSLNSVFDYCKNEEEIMLIGGASLYEQWLQNVDKMYITFINAEFEGDAWFPNFQNKEWETIWQEHHIQETGNQLEYTFKQLNRIKTS